MQEREVTIKALTDLLGVLTWPIVILVVVILLRRELAGLFGRVREIEGPGSIKVSLDANKVEQIIKEGRQDNTTPAAVAERIVQAATVLDRREARILRALFDDDGRAIYSYQNDYYRPALESLLGKEYVRKIDKGFALTPMGQRITREYILGVLQRLESPKPAAPNAAGMP
jgi:hypothetical protein